MRFKIDADDLKSYLERASLKKNLGDNLLIEVATESVYFYNGDSTCVVKLFIDANAEQEGSVIVSIEKLLAFARKFKGEVTIERIDGGISLTCGKKVATMPIIIEEVTYKQAEVLINGITFQQDLETLPSWRGDSWTFEFGAKLHASKLEEAISTCDIIKTGIYTFDVESEELEEQTKLSLTVSSGAINNGGKYKETIPSICIGEPATVSFSAPLHVAFDKSSTINIFLKDDSPLVLVSADAIIMKAPRME